MGKNLIRGATSKYKAQLQSATALLANADSPVF